MSPRRVAAPALLVLLCVVSASTVLAGCPSGACKWPPDAGSASAPRSRADLTVCDQGVVNRPWASASRAWGLSAGANTSCGDAPAVCATTARVYVAVLAGMLPTALDTNPTHLSTHLSAPPPESTVLRPCCACCNPTLRLLPLLPRWACVWGAGRGLWYWDARTCSAPPQAPR